MPEMTAPTARTTSLSPGRFGLQLTMTAETREKLRRAQDLLGDAVEYADLASVLDRALDALIEELERRRYGATDLSRAARTSRHPRHIPVAVRRAVRVRDGDRCTFETGDGKRCEERKGLQLGHIIPFARGGKSTVDNLRLRCRTHNQLEADRAFGTRFMEEKRRRRDDARPN
jgi:5-methylcytosine-specific restriction endonuclease McrA